MKEFADVHPAIFELAFLRALVQWLGVSYLEGGQDENGIDCSGLFIEAMADVGITVADRNADQIHDTFFTLRVPPVRGPVIPAYFGWSGSAYNHIAMLVTPRVLIHSTDWEYFVTENGGNDGVMATDLTFYLNTISTYTTQSLRYLDLGSLLNAQTS
jgi:cell wall-associated NlpC family hydrolase